MTGVVNVPATGNTTSVSHEASVPTPAGRDGPAVVWGGTVGVGGGWFLRTTGRVGSGTG
nr:hypothetical protein [Streptomyces agglomeratus]